ncbi:uncharacterized protein [Nicotiana sylvestris]|uniref:uncharacterized protein n=1 Tax=Nicotiana sylvestris TaxID=4096 RepID=UPI00388CC8B8
MKAQALADVLAKNHMDEEYEPLKTYFPDEEVTRIDELEHIERPGWKLFFDVAANMKGFCVGTILVSEIWHHYPVTAQLRFYYTNNMAEYEIQVRDQHVYCNMVKEEFNGDPWFHDIKEYIKMGVHPVQATSDQKRTIRQLASGFFFSGEVLYKTTSDLGLLRCIDARQATTIITEVHSGVCGPHMSGYVLAKKIL